MRRSAVALVVASLIALALTSAPAAQGSTGGTKDHDDEHANVGLLLNYAGGQLGVCSGTLISPRVVLTAAHCTAGTNGSTLVSFERDAAETAADLPSGDPVTGFRETDAPAGYHAGVGHAHEAYSWFTDPKSWNDLGVVVLAEPVVGIEPARLGTLSGLGSHQVSKTSFTAVGYGAEMVRATSGAQKSRAALLPLTRRYVTLVGQKLTPQILQTQANLDLKKGTGATCTGDSGGPVLLAGEVVAVTSFGINDKCHGVAGAQRVDVDVAAEWIDTFLE